ncbi:MAG TPA: 5-(carboxyamino)imidazole ribonucleotide synthase [Gemmatimonadaceae bacterium]|nr:5-(carboxyamino)imidazole ribonucleotide synthase [Gemmatimonadaceae bacterium]
MTVIPPGATIGILGGGQLGRMTAQAARTMGYAVHVLDPSPDCPAHAVVDRLVTAAFDDVDAAADLARHCDVVTLEIEQIAAAGLEAAQRFAPVRPAPAIIADVQHRGRQKAWLGKHRFPIGPYRDVRTLDDLQGAVRTLGSCFVKSCHGGYDGRSQVRVESLDECAEAWRALGERHAVAEQALDLEMEISVMVARRPSGETVAYTPALNHHTNQVLSWSVLPAPVPDALAARADEIALGIARAMQLEGLLGVEMFCTRTGELFVNELAPRPHNSYHASERACPTGQFEQLVRAVCDLPLGDVRIVEPVAIVNLFGDLWTGGRMPDFTPALALPGVRLHLYGKASARPGRKMGHLSAAGSTPERALSNVRAAAAAIGLVV